MAPLVEEHDRDFVRNYERWFSALYRDKYEYVGEYDLLRLAFLLDLGLYYLGVASQPFRHGKIALCKPIFTAPISAPFFHLMRTYNRRFAQIALARRERGALGRRNDQRRFLFKGYTFGRSSTLPILGALAGWLRLELREGWRSWWQRPAAAKLRDPMLPAVRGVAPALAVTGASARGDASEE